MADIVEQRITPEKPRIIDHQEVKVYTPTARPGKKGIASFNPEDFIVDNSGMVSARNSINTQREYADPLHNPQQMANIDEYGHEKDNSVSLIKLLDIEFKHVGEGEYGYDKRSPKGVVRLDRVKLSETTTIKPGLAMFNSSDVKQSVMPNTYYTQTSIHWPEYPFNDAPANVLQETERKLSFSFDRRFFSPVADESKVVKPLFPIASDWSEGLEAESGYGMVRIDQRSGGPNRWLTFVERQPINNDPLSTDFRMDLSFREDTLLQYLQTELDFAKIVPNYDAGAEFSIGTVVTPDPNDPTLVRKLAYVASFVKPGQTVISSIDGKEYTNGVQLPYGEPYNPETMFQRTVMVIDKGSVGLSRIPNLAPSAWPISDSVRQALNMLQGGVDSIETIQFTKKKDSSEYDQDIGLTYDVVETPTTVKQRIAKIESMLGEVANLQQTFLGYTTVPSGQEPATYLNATFPVNTPGYGPTTSIFVTNTDTLWTWSSTGWVNSNLNTVRGDEFQYKINDQIKTLRVISAGELSNQFEMEFNNSLLELTLNIPYVSEAKYLHNWNSQLANDAENFVPGTPSNGKYQKLWVGTLEEYQSEFTAPPDESVITMITDDVTNFEGNTVDEGYLEDRLNSYTLALLSGTQTNRRYVIKPVNAAGGTAPRRQGWALEEWVPEKFVQVIVDPVFNDGITNIVGAGNEETGILRYNGQNFALLAPGNSPNVDNWLGLSYKGIKETSNDRLDNIILGREGVRAGAYITLPDLANNFGVITENKPLINYLIDSNYKVNNYPNWAEGSPGNISTGAYIRDSVNKLWSAVLSIDTSNTTQGSRIEVINTKLSKYPDPVLSAANGGTYVLNIPSTGTPTTMSLTKLSTIIGENPLSEKTQISTWVHGTGGNVISAKPMTSSNFASNFEEASKVKYKDETGDSSTTSNIKLWVGTKVKYSAVASKDPNTLYICLDGAIYFGTNLISERSITTATVVSEMTQANVQTLLNKLGSV